MRELMIEQFVHLQLVLGDIGIKKPSPVAPPGAGDKVNTILGYVTWFAGAAVVFGVLLGGAMIAVGKMSNNHGAGSAGGKILGGAVAGACVLAVGYTVVNSLSS